MPQLVAALAVLCASAVVGLGPMTSAGAAPEDESFTATKIVKRTTWRASSGSFVANEWTDPATGKPYEVTVKADQTRNLRGRQRIGISWSGAAPSAARAGNPYGENGLDQELPVVVLQCRGIDDPSAPQAQRLSPETCWTSTHYQRSQVKVAPDRAIWTKDPTPGADLGLQTGMSPYPTGAKGDCESAVNGDAASGFTYATHLTPFRAANGTVYSACDGAHMPPEAGAGAAYPPAEVAAYTGLDGTGQVKFEVRSDVENESLGCNHETACSVVVIPIMGTSCKIPAVTPDLADAGCKRGRSRPEGSTNFDKLGVEFAVSPSLWWTPSNWNNRISVPITFGLPPDTCDILDSRPPTGFYGSELLAQTSLQWSPAYCLRKDRFKFQHNQMSDAAGFTLMRNGGAPAAVVSSEHDAAGVPVGYAPTAVTGFGIGYVIDKPLRDDNGDPLEGGEFDDLRINARLIAKLLTQSYPGSSLGTGHPGMSENPWSLNLDPEFIALNPGLTRTTSEAAATLLSLSEASDVIDQLTDYIAHDKDAMDFIGGKADPWGMKVNPSYRDVEVPTPEWRLLDTYVPESEDPCRKANPGVYLSLVAAPVTRIASISQALVDAWPNVQTRCDQDITTSPATYKQGRVARQNYGSRFMLGVVSLGDAARYGIRTARLETKPDTYVGATVQGLSSAVALMKQDAKLGPFALDQAAVKRSATAYPGTMVVYTAARTCKLPAAEARKVEQFIRISTTEGQRAGSGNGELAAGFLPMSARGATAPLLDAANATAQAVASQKCAAATPTAPEAAPGTVPAGNAPQEAPVAAAPAAAAGDPAAAAGAPITNAPIVKTASAHSPVGVLLLPGLLLLGLVGALFGAVAQIVLAVRR
ncbi:hypothetical protein [Nocardioides cavernaquae]|nr:hypothetical protein [Nocardioides cavernaquae]